MIQKRLNEIQCENKVYKESTLKMNVFFKFKFKFCSFIVTLSFEKAARTKKGLSIKFKT